MGKSSQRYLHVGRASELSGRDRIIYRAFEMLPGLLSVGTLVLFIALSFKRPDLAAYLTIVFSMYWLFRTIYLSLHLRYNFKRMRHNMALDWNVRLKDLHYEDVVHLIIFPFYNEAYEVVSESMRGLISSAWDPKKICVVLSVEARAGEAQRRVAERVKKEFSGRFLDFQVAVHPADVEGEIIGKGSNIAYAAEVARTRILDQRKLPYQRVLVSAFDIDTVVYPQYFACLTWHYLTAENPSRTSFQPVPLYNNNIWSAPMLSRVMAYSSSFWQMIQQERPEKLATFSSHAVPFQQLYEVGYWQKNVVSEDSRIFWNLFVHYDGDYEVVPLAYPVSMDANVAPTFFRTAKNIYKQHRRWTYGAENIPYILFTFLKNPRIPFRKKLGSAFVQIEGFWSLVTHPLVLSAVGWLPLLVGGRGFNATVLSYNLPLVAKVFLTASLFGLIVCAAIGMQLVPARPREYGRLRSAQMFLQWALVPATMVIFTSIPGLDAQMRLFFGKYLGFWVTPKMARTAGTT